MAAQKTQSAHIWNKKPKTKRKGIHAKSKTSKNKQSTNYKKLYTQQG